MVRDKEIGNNGRGQAPLTRPKTQGENKSDGATSLDTSRLTFAQQCQAVDDPSKGRLKRNLCPFGRSRKQT